MKNTVTHQIEVPRNKDELAKTILNCFEASFAEASTTELKQIAESLKPKVIDTDKRALAKKIAGDDYSEGNLALLELANLKLYYQRRRGLLEG
ncbi:MAG: hypothetical protein AAFO95_17315, partial [Cyanobacteria bacterium J06600_6]